MRSRWVRAFSIAFGAVVIGLLVIRANSGGSSDTTGPGGRLADPIRDNEAGKALRFFLSVMFNSGENAANIYREALDRLRAHAEGVAAEIAVAEPSLRETDYPGRWALIFAASELRHPAALSWLRFIALSRIPTERSQDPHSFSTVAEETILRTTAVEGIGHLARDGNAQAAETLFECLERPSISLRRAAVQALLSTDEGQRQRERIASALPEDARFLLDLRRIEVRDVRQIQNPEQFLVRAARMGTSSAPSLPGDRPNGGKVSTPLGRNQPPKIG